MHSHQLISLPYKYLIFCYILFFTALIGCKEVHTDKSIESSAIESDETTEEVATETSVILCFGDSITAGYGLDDTDDAFPGLLQEKIDSLDLGYTVVNSGVSGETSAGGKSRIGWVMDQEVAIFLLELGANDGLRGVPIAETKSNLQAIIDTVQKKSPDTQIILAGMQLPPNMGQGYTEAFRQLYIDLADSNKIAFIPFILEDVGGVASLNQSDGIHPTEKGHQIVANTVWNVLGPMIKD